MSCYLITRSYVALCHITLRCVALHCVALHCIALRFKLVDLLSECLPERTGHDYGHMFHVGKKQIVPYHHVCQSRRFWRVLQLIKWCLLFEMLIGCILHLYIFLRWLVFSFWIWSERFLSKEVNCLPWGFLYLHWRQMLIMTCSLVIKFFLCVTCTA